MSRLHVSGQLPLQLLRRGIFRRGWVCWGKRNLINCRRRFFVRTGVCKVTLCTTISTKAIVSATFFLFVGKGGAEEGCRSRGVTGRWGVANAITKRFKGRGRGRGLVGLLGLVGGGRGIRGTTRTFVSVFGMLLSDMVEGLIKANNLFA